MDARVNRAMKGDSVALGELIFEHHDDLVQLLASRIPNNLKSVLDAEDVLQKAYIDAFRGIARLETPSERAFRGWLEAIAENRLIDAIRAYKSKKRSGDHSRIGNCQAEQCESAADLFDLISSEVTTPSRKVARDEGVKELLVKIDELSPAHGEVVRLYHLNGLDVEEVAHATGRTVDAVRGILYRARKELRRAMGQSSLWLSKK